MSGKDMIEAFDALDALPPGFFAVDPADEKWKPYVDEATLRAEIAAEIEQFADDDSDVSDAYRHAALIAKGTQP